MPTKRLTVFIPGLFGDGVQVDSKSLPDLPSLNWLLTRGDYLASPKQPTSTLLCHLFGLPLMSKSDFPIAAISRLADHDRSPAGHWLRADPVSIKAHREGLILFDDNHFDLSEAEAQALATELAPLLATYHLSLEMPFATRWYLQVPSHYQLQTSPIECIVGKDIQPFMPIGADRMVLTQMMNDIQMVLHDATVNQKREQQKIPPINSLWLWGYGALPEAVTAQWSFVISDEVLAKGLSMLAQIDFSELPADYHAVKSHENDAQGLIVMSGLQQYNDYHDPMNWAKTLMQYEQHWFTPLLEALKHNKLEQLQLQTESAVITINARCRYKFWRNNKTLYSFRSEI